MRPQGKSPFKNDSDVKFNLKKILLGEKHAGSKTDVDYLACLFGGGCH
jgi:hypothetical protein